MRTNLKIGEQGFPIDNSYSFTIGSKDEPRLAGTAFEHAKLVTVVSKPYYKKAKTCLGNKVRHKFVTVMYDNKCHVILDGFED
jgi:hypothetical protein